MAEVHALPPICQAMLCLRFIEEKSYPEIGNLLGMNNQKVRRDTLKLVAALRRQFPDDGGCAA
jgi:DNA-directed RNA polymerase specialized sigma24 family protein